MKNLDNLTDPEIVEYLTGKRITIVNSLSGREEQVVIVSTKRKPPTLTDGVLRFFSPEGCRWVKLSSIVSVGRKRIA